MRIALTARLGLVLATLAALGGGCAFRSNSSADADDSIIDGDQPGSWSVNGRRIPMNCGNQVGG